MNISSETEKKNPFRELIEPFSAIIKAPRALWGVNLTYLVEGMCYFGILTLLAMFFNDHVSLDDAHAGWIVGAFTGGITLAMFFFGEVADRWGVRNALLLSLVLMVAGRIFLSGAEWFGGNGMWSPVFFSASGGLLFVVIGYGMYQPAAYAAVRQFTTKKTAAMGYAMLYALMNLGGFLPGIVSPPIRNAYGISGIFWVYTGFTVFSVVLLFVFMTKHAVKKALSKEESEGSDTSTIDGNSGEIFPKQKSNEPFQLRQWLREHPLADVRFSFFIFILIPVQTLMAHQWLTMPLYVDRAFPGWVSENMEFFVNLNPLLIFVLTPIVAALTGKVDVYKMMIWGTLVMGAPTFILAIGANVVPLFAYILFMSVGEAMWSPRFYQLAAELAPEGKTGQYMGIAQFPWFLTKLITSTYSGYMLTQYCPENGPQNTEMLWFIYGMISLITPAGLLLARKWMGNKLETSH